MVKDTTRTSQSKPMCYDCPHRTTRGGNHGFQSLVARTMFKQPDGTLIELHTPHICHNNSNHTCTGHRLDLRDRSSGAQTDPNEEIQVAYKSEPIVPTQMIDPYDK